MRSRVAGKRPGLLLVCTCGHFPVPTASDTLSVLRYHYKYTTKEQKTTFAKERSKPGRWRCGVVHAWVGQIVTFFATAPLAAPWAP